MIMSHEVQQTEIGRQSQQLLHGPLKHARTAALAMALVPLAAVAVTTQVNESCPSAGVCGTVFYDANNNGVQDAGEPGIEGAVVTTTVNGNSFSVATNSDGVYYFPVPQGTYEIAVQIPPETQPSPSNVGSDDAADSDGVSDTKGNSVATVTMTSPTDSSTDFGFWKSPVVQPGTGTPGYWKNHPEAWPVATITVGGVTYSKADAIAWLDAVSKDRTTTMFSSLVSAKLNVLIGNDASCVSSTIDAADAWMATYGPVGNGVAASSLAWKLGEPLHRLMDNYNNGMLCAPHRD
jgi:hypothetical protein